MREFWDIYDINRKLTGRTVERGKPMAEPEGFDGQYRKIQRQG